MGQLKHIISSRNDTLGLTRELGDSITIEGRLKEWQIKAKDLVTDTINSKAGKFIT
ncbi:MAG: hypothetical protein ACP5I9_03840 [Candidatus Kapaibacteriota bacterium]